MTTKTKKPTKTDRPDHFYQHTQKWQCNGPHEWRAVFIEQSKDASVPEHLRGTTGAGMRIVIAAGIKALAGQKVAPSKAVKARAKKAAKTEITHGNQPAEATP